MELGSKEDRKLKNRYAESGHQIHPEEVSPESCLAVVLSILSFLLFNAIIAPLSTCAHVGGDGGGVRSELPQLERPGLPVVPS